MSTIKKYWLGLFVMALFVIASFLIYKKLNPKQLPPNLIAGVGRIDGDLIAVSSKYPGKVLKVNVSEGDKVKKGQVLAVLSKEEYQAQLNAVKAQVKAKEKDLKALHIELQILKETLPEDVKKAQEDIKSKKALLSQIEKSIDSMRQIVAQDEKDFKRLKNLFEKNLIPEKKFEDIKVKLTTDKNQLLSLQEKRKQVIAGIKASQSTLNQAKSVLKKIKIMEKQIDALKAGISALKAEETRIKAVIKQLTLVSPVDGYIVDKIRNEGEVVGSGMPVVTVIDPSQLYLKIYVDTINNGKIKIGDKAVIFLDGYPDRPIPAKVIKIARKAEFTPKEVAVREDRIQRVYAVHIKPIKPDPLLKLGLPAIGVISIDGKNLPESLKEIPPM